MRTWLVGVPLILAIASAAEANLNAWSIRVGSGAQDYARRIANDNLGNLFIAYQTDGKVAIAKVEPQNGVTLWSRILGPGDPVTAYASPYNTLLVASTERDTSGRSHSVARCVSMADGSVRWTVRGIGGLDVVQSQIASVSSNWLLDSVYLAGSQDGQAVWSQHSWATGNLWREGVVSGKQISRVWGETYIAEGDGGGWVGRIGAYPKESQIVIPGRENASLDRLVLGFDRSRSYGVNLWVAGRLSSPGRSPDVFAASFDSDSYRASHQYTYDSGFADEVIEVGQLYSAGAMEQARVLVRSTDARGNRRSTSWPVQHQPFSGHNEPVVTLPFNMTSLEGSAGTAFLARTGWDLVVMPGKYPQERLLSFDGGLSADDELAAFLNHNDNYYLMTSFKNGRSQARLLKLQSLWIAGNRLRGGSLGSVDLRLAGPAPSQGYEFTVSLSAGGPVTLLTPRVRIGPGETSAKVQLRTSTVVEQTEVFVTATAQGQKWTEGIWVTPTQLSSFTISPISVVGCVTARGQVTLDSPAPSGGLSVALSSDRGVVDVPDHVIVPAGQRTAEFEACTFATNSDVDARLTATAGGVSQTKILRVLRPTLLSARFEPATVKGGLPACASLRISGPAPVGGLRFSATCTGAILSPGSLTIFANRDEQSFNLATKPVTRPTPSTLTVTANGRTMAATAIVVP